MRKNIVTERTNVFEPNNTITMKFTIAGAVKLLTCQMLLPVIEELAGEVTNAKICKVNVDEQPELAQKFRVMTIPTLIVMKEGKVVSTTVGVKPKAAILEMLNV